MRALFIGRLYDYIFSSSRSQEHYRAGYSRRGLPPGRVLHLGHPVYRAPHRPHVVAGIRRPVPGGGGGVPGIGVGLSYFVAGLITTRGAGARSRPWRKRSAANAATTSTTAITFRPFIALPVLISIGPITDGPT